jgi:transposase
LEGILWVLRTVARWKDLPRSFPSYATCWRRFVDWSGDGIWEAAWQRLITALDRQGKVNWDEGFADGTVRLDEKGGDRVGPTKRGKGSKLMLLVDGAGLPLAIDIDSASPAEVTLIEPLLDEAVTPFVPDRRIYDRAADSDPLRERLAARNIELICPHRRRRKRPPTQDGRPLRRFRKRWIVERTISWLHAFRRLVTRYEYYAFLFHSFAKLACIMIVLRWF